MIMNEGINEQLPSAAARGIVTVAVLAVVQDVRQPNALDIEVAASIDLVDHLVHLVQGADVGHLDLLLRGTSRELPSSSFRCRGAMRGHDVGAQCVGTMWGRNAWAR